MATKKKAETSSDDFDAPAGYAEAMAEIERILAELDSPSIDVDALASKVSRASELIAWCNERITAAEFTVQNLVASLDFEESDEDE